MDPTPRQHPSLLALLTWGIAAPLVFSWGLGTVHPALDLLSIPAAFLASVPSEAGWIGFAIVSLFSIFALIRPQFSPLSHGAALWGSLAWLGPAAAANRPLPWVPVAVWLWFFFRQRKGESGRAVPDAWALGPRATTLLAPGLWLAASRVRPFGEGLLPVGFEDGLASVFDRLPDAAEALPAFLLALGAAALLQRRAPIDRGGATLGAALGLVAVATFGVEEAWVSALAIGAVAGGWPADLRRLHHGSPVLGPILLACLLSAVRLGGTERWNCSVAHDDLMTRFLLSEGELGSLGVVPGNLPYLVAMRGAGERLERFSTTGTVNESVALDPPGGLLLSSPRDRTLLRFVEGGLPQEGDHGTLRLEVWDPAVMEIKTLHRTGAECGPEQAAWDPETRTAWVACADGDTLRIGPEGDLLRWPESGETSDLDRGPGSLLRLRGGPIGTLSLTEPDGTPQFDLRLGPYTPDAEAAPDRLLIARGPAGQVEIRGAHPHIEARDGAAPTGLDALRAALSTVRDRARVGNWPGDVLWTESMRSAYVTSPVDARARLVDGDVTWHQWEAMLGAPARQVVLDSSSGTLYGVNRCDVFEVRIPTTFPWSSPGDIEEANTGPAATEPP